MTERACANSFYANSIYANGDGTEAVTLMTISLAEYATTVTLAEYPTSVTLEEG